MKKLSFIAVAFAAMVFASCGGNKNANTAENIEIEKSFEQEQIEEKIKVELDSIANDLTKLNQLPFVQEGENGLKLTDQEKQVKPDYLLDPAVAEKAQTLTEKYRIISALGVDRRIAQAYDLNVDEYNNTLTKLLADVNDPSFKDIQDATTIFETSQGLYEAMEKNGRINFFWQLVAGSLVEEIFAMTQNSEKFLAVLNDQAVADITLRIVILTDAIDRLTQYDTELIPVAEAIKPLKALNATTIDELKGQLEQTKEQITAARDTLLK